MKISVIIPTYKPQSYIWECLDSLKNQTFDKSQFEIIIVLNGCKEPYETQIREYIITNLEGFHVNFIQTDLGGVSNDRNIAIDSSKGDFITFVDDDDYVSPTYLDELYHNIELGCLPISNLLAFFDGSDEKVDYYITKMFKRIVSKGKTPIMLARSYMSNPVAKLIPKDVIGNRKFNLSFKNGEDALFMLTISDKINYVCPTSKNAIYYRRIRANSAVTRNRSKKEVFMNKIKLAGAFIPCLCKPWRYNFLFCVSRFVALFK